MLSSVLIAAAKGPIGFPLGYLAKQPFVLLFLTVAAGYALGKVKVKGITLGATAATLLVALIVSVVASFGFQIDYKIPEFASTVFFNLFMFSVGMKVGPQFLSGLKRDAKSFIILAVMVPVLSVGLTIGAQALFKLPPGMMPGLLAGANTATPGIGSAQTALAATADKLPAGTTLDQALSNLSTAFAFTYCVSMVVFVVVMKVMPRIFGRDAVADAQEYEKGLRGSATAPLPGTAEEFLHGLVPVTVRVYKVENPALLNQPLSELAVRYPRGAIERVMREGKVVTPTGEFRLKRGDEIAVNAKVSTLTERGGEIGTEVSEPALRNVGMETVNVVVHDKNVIGRKMGEVASEHGNGLFLNAMFRAGDQIPAEAETVVERGDVLRITGSRERINRVVQNLGPVVRPSLSTDILTLALGVSVGALIGALQLPLGAVRLSLSAAVGLLLTGIVLSILRTRNPALGGPYPEPARQLIEDLGLNVFIAITGLNAGVGVVQAIKTGSIGPVLIAGLVVGLLPAFLAWALGQYRFKMNSALLMGAVAGARCNSAGMRAGQEATHSNVPAIAYPVTFAVSNVLLTLFSYLLALVH